METAATQTKPAYPSGRASPNAGFKNSKSPRRRTKVCIAAISIAGDLSLKAEGAWRLETAATQTKPAYPSGRASPNAGFKNCRSPREADFVCIAAISIAGDLSLKAGGAWRLETAAIQTKPAFAGFKNSKSLREADESLSSVNSNRRVGAGLEIYVVVWHIPLANPPLQDAPATPASTAR